MMNKITLSEIELYNSIYKYIDSNMYVLLSQNEALVVDPHVNEEIKLLLEKHKIQKITIILTHEHSDHISGVWWFQENFDCKIICSEKCAEKILNPRSVRPLFLSFILEENDRNKGTNLLSEFKNEFIPRTYSADITYSDEFHYSWQNHELYFKAIQGHSAGSCFIILDNKYVFTGDSLLKQYPVIVSFPGGNKKAYIDETLLLFEQTLRSNMTILPGHGGVFALSDIMTDGKIKVGIR